MSDIPHEILSKALALREKNGLPASEAALREDLQQSKAAWTVNDTPRYRRAGESPIFISGKYLTKIGVCPATGERDGGRNGVAKPVAAKAKAEAPLVKGEINRSAFYRVLHAKGFKVAILRDEISGEVKEEIPQAIAALGLKFETMPRNAEKGIYVSQTNPQIQVSMTLDQFLEIARLSPQ